ncbi:MAG: ABC-F family ATP-binding cassette domain-containing protein [Chloroflexi bacterium]|nr:ABC-F family ATP-binding cassette domain-containing protein [Chloroflexota bacterium]
MTALTIEHITKTYGPLTVLNDISFTLAPGQRIGIVGANGVGKSTLLKIVTGELEPDGGKAALRPGTRLGYLPQEDNAVQGTIASLIEQSLADLRTMEAEMRVLEAGMGDLTGDALSDLLDRYGELTDAFERAGGWDAEARVGMVLAGLRIDHLPRDRDIRSLSGGERARLQLALLLLSGPDVLLLDEPTNHLDVDSMAWLEGYVRELRGAVLMVSHDRTFLNATVTSIIEIDEFSHRAKQYTGDYDDYLKAKTRERLRWEQEYAAQQDEVKDLRIAISDEIRAMSQTKPTKKVGGDKFAKGFFKGRTEIHLTRKLDNVKERLARIEADPIPRPPRPLTFRPDFDPRALRGQFAITISGVSKRYGQRAVIDDFSLSVAPDARIAIVGPNGSGKSTLLRMIVGVEAPDSGVVHISPQVRIGYLDQFGADLDDVQTVVEAYIDGSDLPEQAAISDLLVSGLFRYDEVRRTVGMLSGGQRRKLQIAKLIRQQANVLILDEPTNTLSFDVLEAFEDALRSFPGAIIAATHDRRFLEGFGGTVLALGDRQLSAVH